MALDPLLKAFLDQMAAVPGPKMWEVTPSEARQAFVALMQLAGPKDVPIGKVENLTVLGKGGDIPVRLYSPVAAGSEALPALVYFHGGGWVIGDLDTHDGLCRMFANEAGCRVVAVDYRLSPEHKWPVAIEDSYAVLTWLESHGAELGIDANRIAVGGDSAGGNIAAVMAQTAREKGYPTLAFQMLLFPVTQIGSDTSSLHEFAVGYFLEKQTLDWFYANYLPAGADTNDPAISPLRAKDLAGLPPAYVMLGGFDPLHDEGLQYAHRLREAGVATTIADYGDMVHCFIYLQSVLPQAREAMNAACKALHDALDAH